MLQKHVETFKNILEIFQKFVKIMLKIHQKYVESMQEISEKCCEYEKYV